MAPRSHLASPAPVPPRAARNPVVVEGHGHRLTDPYAWMRDPGYPDVTDETILAHLTAENGYFDAVMAPLKGRVEALFEELKGRIKEDDSSVPVRDGDWVYRWRFEAGAQYRQWLRAPAGGGPETVILDEVARALGRDYYRLRDLAVSPDGRLMAWSEDADGSERFAIHLKDLETGEERFGLAENASGVIVWTAGSDAFLYVELTPEQRPFRVRLHRLDGPSDDPVLYEESDPGFFVGLDKTQSRAFILVESGDHVTSEVRLLPADDPTAEAVLVAPRRAGHEYDVDETGGTLFIRTNDRHRDFRLVTAPADDPAEANWAELMPPGGGIYYRGHVAFRDQLVVVGRENGLDRVWLRDHATGEKHAVAFPEDLAACGLGANPEPAISSLRLSYQSMTTPPTVYDYDLADRRLVERKVQEIPSGYDKARFRTERMTARAPDGTAVPVSLVYPADHPRDGSRPLYLYAYGAYGHGLPPYFSTARLSLLERGFAFAIAHVRGGDELGYGWYEAGKGAARMNAFTDFIACAEALIQAGFAAPGRIAIAGGSAGGTLVGTALNLRPDLWGCAAAHVPFVDVLNTMLDDSLPLTPIEWPEWGNPIADSDAFETILAYSPYENVTAQAYPPILATAGLNDPRVTYWEPAKWVARLRALNTGDGPVLLKTNMGAGHGGKSGRFEALEEMAEEYAFVLATLGGGLPAPRPVG